MKKLFEILIVIGFFVGIFSALIPFTNYFTKEVENIIYFRGILLGFFLASYSSAVLLKEKVTVSSLIGGLSSGIFSLLITSTYNLICDTCIRTQIYFSLTFIITFSGFLTILIIRLWQLNKYRFSD